MLIIPEQFSFESERDILRIAGPENLNKIQILSFTRLASNTLKETDPSLLDDADDAARAMIMTLAYTELTAGNMLDCYRADRLDDGTLISLLSLDNELKAAAKTPDELLAAAEKEKQNSLLRKKCDQTAQILKRYNDILSEHFDDRKTVLTRLAETLREKKIFEGYTVCVDSFADFSADQYLVLEEIMTQAADVYVTVCADVPHLTEDGAADRFSHTKRIVRELESTAKKRGVAVAEPRLLAADRKKRFGSDDLQTFEEELFGRGICENEKKKTDDIVIAEMPGVTAECEFIARECKRLLREKKLRCRDITVIERKKGDYDKELVSAFGKQGLPVFEDKRHSLGDEPLIRLVLAAVSIAANGFDTDQICRYAKCSLSPVASDDICALDNYALVWQLKPSEWKQEWTRNPAGFAVEFGEKEKKKLAALNRLREDLVAPLEALREKLINADGYDRSRALYDFLTERSVPEQLAALASELNSAGREDEATAMASSWDTLMDALHNIAVITEGRNVRLADYHKLLCAYLRSVTVGEIPQGLDEITVGAADRIRVSSPKVVFIAGACQGVFPLAPREGGVFTAAEKQKLTENGLKISDDTIENADREKYIMYSALTAATDKLYISYPLKNAGGEECIPSVISDEIKRVFPETVTRTRASGIDAIESKADAFARLAYIYGSETREKYELLRYFENDPGYKDKLDALERAVNSAPVKFADSSVSERLFGRDMNISASKAEEYHQCPFGFFCKYGLGLKARKTAKIEPSVNGTIIHRVLEVILRDHPITELDEMGAEGRLPLVSEIIREYERNELGDDLGARMENIIASYANTAETVLSRIIDEFRTSGFKITATEVPVGYKDRDVPIVPSPEIDIPGGGRITIHGYIDRVDTLEADGRKYVRVIDYKTGGKDFKIGELLYGVNMQMLIYLMSLWKTENEYNGLPAGIAYLPAKTGTLGNGRDPTPEDVQKQSKSNGKMNGLFLSDGEVIAGLDSTGKFAYFGIKINKDGELTGDIITLGTFELIHRKINRILAEMGANLHEGNIPVFPFETEGSSEVKCHCAYCDFKSICNENYKNRNKAQKLSGDIADILKEEEEKLNEMDD